MPAFNREREIARALSSCLEQGFQDFEVVVVDDGSTDQTAQVMNEFSRKDVRIRPFQHARNRGVCPARNTAIANARGSWLLMLDSDMSLREGALEVLKDLTDNISPKFGNVATAVAWDTGKKTPDSSQSVLDLSYGDYVAWVESLRDGEYFNCIRREVFEQGLRYPESRAYEGGFHLDLANGWGFAFRDVVTITYHTDASNRLCAPKDWRMKRNILEQAALDVMLESERIYSVHGPILEQRAPQRYQRTLLQILLSALLAGSRRRGVRYWLLYLRRHGPNWRAFAILLLGIVHSRLLSTAVSSRK